MLSLNKTELHLGRDPENCQVSQKQLTLRPLRLDVQVRASGVWTYGVGPEPESAHL